MASFRIPRWIRRTLIWLGSLVAFVAVLAGGVWLYVHPALERIDGIVYGHRGARPLTLDILRPANPNGLGIALMVSGGWRSKKPGETPAWLVAPAKAMSLNNVYVRALKRSELLDGGASAKVWDSVSFAAKTKSDRKGEVSWKLAGPATIYGFAYWWVAGLSGDIVLSTAPGAPATHWEQLYFPLLEPLTCLGNHSVTLSLRSRSSASAGTHLGWTAVHFDAAGRVLGRQALDLDKGFLP